MKPSDIHQGIKVTKVIPVYENGKKVNTIRELGTIVSVERIGCEVKFANGCYGFVLWKNLVKGHKK